MADKEWDIAEYLLVNRECVRREILANLLTKPEDVFEDAYHEELASLVRRHVARALGLNYEEVLIVISVAYLKNLLGDHWLSCPAA